MSAVVIRPNADVELQGQLGIPILSAVAGPLRLSRGTVQRIRRNAVIDSATVATMQALNALAGVESLEVERESLDDFSSVVFARVRALHADRPPPPGLDREAAVAELLGSQAHGYANPDEISTTAPYARHRVAWPSRGQTPVDLGRRLPPLLRSQFGGVDMSWMRTATQVREFRLEEGAVKAHMNETLRGDAAAYVDFVKGGLDRGIFLLGRRRQR